MTEVSRVLSGLVEQHAVGQVVEAATSIDLLEYERPDFHNALQRPEVAAMTRPVQMVSGLTAMLGVITGIIGIAARAIVSAADPGARSPSVFRPGVAGFPEGQPCASQVRRPTDRALTGSERT